MAKPATREQLKQYALRALGKPVIEINVDDDQLEDRIDEALQYFAQYHYDGVKRTYLKYKYTQADKDRILGTTTETASKTYGDSTTVSTEWKEDNAYIIMRSVNKVVAMIHSTATQWQHQFRVEITLEKASKKLIENNQIKPKTKIGLLSILNLIEKWRHDLNIKNIN